MRKIYAGCDMTNSTAVSGPAYHKSPEGDPIKEFVAPLIYQHGDITQSIGTVTIIQSHLALTSRHVIEQHLRDVGITEVAESNDVTFNLYTYQIISETVTATWAVVNCFLAPNTDIAILKLVPGNEAARNAAGRRIVMELHPPDLGTHVAGFGYPKTHVNTDETPTVLELDSHTTTGSVTAIYKEKRDSVMIPFPCLEVNARFVGGMSGGPIFNEKGNLIGLITTGVDSDSEEFTSYVALLWPLMNTRIELNREDRPELDGTMYPFLELAREGHIMALHWERITLYEEGGAQFTKFDFNKGFGAKML